MSESTTAAAKIERLGGMERIIELRRLPTVARHEKIEEIRVDEGHKKSLKFMAPDF